jgi:transcription antitermination factor NusG
VTENGGALSLLIPSATHLNAPSVSAASEVPWFWFAVQTRPRHEKKVNSELREKDIRSFLPLHREKRRWSDRLQWVESPLFSNYLFVKIPLTAESRVDVLRTSGVLRFAGMPGCGTPVPDEQIENLQAIMDQQVPLAQHQFIKVGERVRIRGGALNGIEGILAAIKNDRSLVVSVDLIQKSVAIRIDGFELERV